MTSCPPGKARSLHNDRSCALSTRHVRKVVLGDVSACQRIYGLINFIHVRFGNSDRGISGHRNKYAQARFLEHALLTDLWNDHDEYDIDDALGMGVRGTSTRSATNWSKSSMDFCISECSDMKRE